MKIPTPAPETCTRSFLWVIGGGPTGLLAATEAAHFLRRSAIPTVVRLLEADTLGGGTGDRTASSRSQLWCHTDGALDSLTRPEVTLALQKSTRRLRRLAPLAFRRPPALAVDLPGAEPRPTADACFRALGVRHRGVPLEVAHAWLPGFSLPNGSQVWRVRDGVLDLRFLTARLAELARAAGVEVYRERVLGLGVRGDRVIGLKLADQAVTVPPDDEVVFACGASVRPLLRTAGVIVPDLRVCVSNLVSSDRLEIRTQLAVLRGGVRVVPHEQPDGRVVNVFSSGVRCELPPEADGCPLHADPFSVERVCREVRETTGVEIPPEGRLAWPVARAELGCTGTGAESHRAQLVPGLSNAWLAIPGNLSLAAECARDLALQLGRRRVGAGYAAPIWERAVGAGGEGPLIPSPDEPETVFPLLVKAGA